MYRCLQRRKEHSGDETIDPLPLRHVICENWHSWQRRSRRRFHRCLECLHRRPESALQIYNSTKRYCEMGEVDSFAALDRTIAAGVDNAALGFGVAAEAAGAVVEGAGAPGGTAAAGAAEPGDVADTPEAANRMSEQLKIGDASTPLNFSSRLRRISSAESSTTGGGGGSIGSIAVAGASTCIGTGGAREGAAVAAAAGATEGAGVAAVFCSSACFLASADSSPLLLGWIVHCNMFGCR
jgi:hypothetical protein